MTTYRDRLAEYFKAHAHQWVDGLTLAQIGGAYASRTRISECRTQLGMTIRNRVRRSRSGVAISEYCYVPAAAPAQANLFSGAA